MSARDDGGPAFPVPSYVNADGETHDASNQGMSLRDWFAGMVLQGMFAGTTTVGRQFHYIAIEAYAVAEQMLKERAK